MKHPNEKQRILKSQLVQEFDGHEEIYSGRRLQIEDRENSIVRVSLSIWGAQLATQDAHMDLLNNQEVQEGVVDAVLQVLCTVTDLRLVDRAATFFDPDILDVFDTCSTFKSRRRAQEEGSTALIPAVLSAWPELATMLRASDDLLWSTWTIAFPLLRIGDLYIEEALMNNEGISILEIGGAAKEALEQVVQLALDVSMMEGKFDDILHRTVEENILYAAPITQEEEIFTVAAQDYEQRYQFTARSVYPMRVLGVFMFFSSILILVLLTIASKLRRQRILQEMETTRQETPSIVHFRDAIGVEKLLEQSSPGAFADHANTSRGEFTSDDPRSSRLLRELGTLQDKFQRRCTPSKYQK